MTDVLGILEQMDEDKLDQLKLVRRGISQTSQGGLEREVHTPARLRQGTWHLATAETATEETTGGGEGTNEAVEAPKKSVVVWPRLPVATATASKPPKVLPQPRGATGMVRRAIG